MLGFLLGRRVKQQRRASLLLLVCWSRGSCRSPPTSMYTSDSTPPVLERLDVDGMPMFADGIPGPDRRAVLLSPGRRIYQEDVLTRMLAYCRPTSCTLSADRNCTLSADIRMARKLSKLQSWEMIHRRGCIEASPSLHTPPIQLGSREQPSYIYSEGKNRSRS